MQNNTLAPDQNRGTPRLDTNTQRRIKAALDREIKVAYPNPFKPFERAIGLAPPAKQE